MDRQEEIEATRCQIEDCCQPHVSILVSYTRPRMINGMLYPGTPHTETKVCAYHWGEAMIKDFTKMGQRMSTKEEQD